MLNQIFNKVKYFSKFIISMVITFFGFFLSNKDEDEGTQKTIKNSSKPKLENEKETYNQALEDKPLNLYPFYKHKTEKLLKEPVTDLKKHQKELEKLLKEIPETEEMKPVRKKIEKRLEELKQPPVVQTAPQIDKPIKKHTTVNNQDHITKQEPNVVQKEPETKQKAPKIKTSTFTSPALPPQELYQQELPKKPQVGFRNEKATPKQIQTEFINIQTLQNPKLVKSAPLVAIIPPIMAMHIMRKKQNQELKTNQPPKYNVQKNSPNIAIEPKIVPKTKYVIPQVYLNEAIHLSKKIDRDALTKQKLTEKKDNIPDKIEYLLNKKTNSKTRLLPFKLFKRKEVQSLYNAQILNNNLISSVNLLNGTNFSYQKVHFLTLLSRKKTLASLENVTEKNIETAQMLKVSMKNKFGNRMETDLKLSSILRKLEELEEELNQKYERLNNHNHSKAKMKSKTPIRPF